MNWYLKCPAQEVKAMTMLVRFKMEKALKLDVPLKVDVGLVRTGCSPLVQTK